MRPSPKTLAWARRELAAIRHINQRLQRRMMRSGDYEPRKVFRVDRKALRRLGVEIAALPKRRRIRAEQARRLIRQIMRLNRRQQRVETLVARALHQQKQILYRARLGSVTLENLSIANGLDRQLEWLLYRKGARGEDAHASAMVRKRNQALAPGQLAG